MHHSNSVNLHISPFTNAQYPTSVKLLAVYQVFRTPIQTLNITKFPRKQGEKEASFVITLATDLKQTKLQIFFNQ